MPTSLSLGFDDLACFVSVARCGSFTGAAAELRVTKPTVSRHVRSLETLLGVQLFVRTSRAVRLTADGRTYLEYAARAVDAADAGMRAMRGGGKDAFGVLRVTTTPFFGDVLIAPIMIDYLRRYPGASLELELTVETVDLVAGDFDVAIRFGPLRSSGLIARRIGRSFIGCFASPAYLEAHGEPENPHALARHATISVSDGVTSWPFHRGGRRFLVELRPRLASASYALAATAARAGLGVAMLPGPVVRGAVERGELVHVLADWTAPPIPVHAVMPKRAPLPARTRAFVDLLLEASHGEQPLAHLGLPQRRVR